MFDLIISLARYKMYRSTFQCTLLATFALGAVPGSLLAQEDGDTTTRNEFLEEVVVTATRREANLMDVPISITALTGDELDQFGAIDITYISQVSPNTTLEVSRGTNTTLSAFMRGVGQQDPVAGFESGVGIYLDDVYLNRPQAAVLDIYDVERIEVLRGPQGTLYGRNTIGGAIKYVTKPLADDAQFKSRLSYGTDNMVDVVLTGSTPVSDTFKLGGSIASLTRDGFGDNLYLPGIENYNKDVLAARVSAEWDVTENFFLRFTGDWVQDDSDPRQGHRLTQGNLTGAPVLPNVYDTRAGLNNPIQDVEAKGYSLVAEWQVNDMVEIRNIFSQRDDESWSPIDFDSLPEADLDVPVLYENEQTSNEIQVLLTSDRWSAVTGLYYLDANATNEFDVILGTTGEVLGLPGLNAYTFGDVDTEAWAAYADFSFEINENWMVSVGGRYTDDKRTSNIVRQTKIGGTSPVFGGTAIPIATTSDFVGSETFDKFTPRASLSYFPNEDHNLYVSYAEGFKSGSFDPRGLTTAAPDLNGDGVVSDQEIFDFMKFDPEEVKGLEFGWKATLLDGRMTSSFAIFLNDYQDVQIPGSIGFDSDGDGISDSFIGITTNAADADINGAEWEGSALIGQNMGASGSDLTLGWAIGYIDADFNTYIDAFGNDVADQRVFQNTPEWTASTNLQLNVPVNWFSQSGNLSLVTMLSYRDDHSQFEAPNPFLDQESYTLWDLSAVWSDDSGHWKVGIHGKNLTDEEYKVAGYFFPTLGLESSITAFYGNPRQIWGTVEYRWFK